MSVTRQTRRARWGIMTVLAVIMALGPVYAAKKIVERATSASLGGTERYLGHVSTDKPIYRMGETVYARSVFLHAANRSPLASSPDAKFKVVGPKGDTITEGYAQTQDGVAGFGWLIPDGQAGGAYTIKVTCPALGVAPSERKFDIRAFRAPRLKTQIVFLRDGYGPGDRVSATLEAFRAEGGVPADANVTVTARLDGKEIHRSTTVVNRAGNCTAQFALPASIARGEGTLAFAVEDGGVVETATKTIPILLQTVDLSIYPEGGDLVAALANRVYIEARTPAGKPADLAGIVVDAQGLQVATFRTAHEGRGVFTFRPVTAGNYTLKITEPSGIKTEYPLPKVKDSGVLIQATEQVYPAGEPVAIQVHSSIPGALTVTLSKREVELASLKIKGNKDAGRRLRADVTLTPPASADGILVATVWDADGNPLAERLIYRTPAETVNIEVISDRDRYVPGGKAQLTLRTTDEAGKPVSAMVGLTVTDDSVLEMIETREQAPRLPVMVLLENDINELADAHVYLDRNNPDAPEALDLLLGTQGWRRFAFIDAAAFLKKHGDAGRRVLALRVVTERERWEVRRKAGMAGNPDRFFKGMHMDGAAMPQGAAMPEEELAGAEGAEIPADGRERKQDEKEHDKAVADLERPARADEPAASMVAPVVVADDLFEIVMAEEASEVNMIIGGKLKRRRQSLRYMTVRLYAHKVRANRRAGDRVDFTETLYWTAGVKTDKKSGEAVVSFDLNDAVTSFRVLSDAFTPAGALGSDSRTIESVKPFYVEPKLPLEVTMGDRILLPIGVVNGTDSDLPGGALEIASLKGIDISKVAPFALAADQRIRRLITMAVGDISGSMNVVLKASAGSYADRVTRPLRVVPRGFPVEVAHGGMLTPDGATEVTITIPESRVPGSVTSDLAVYPTPLANLTEALERLIREPCGCFEQTSSSTYPLVMAQQYFMSHQGVDPKLIARSKELLTKGYKRLTGFECSKKGYEWFGGDPGHEALTAYGLLEFTDMAAVSGDVDQGMLKRTREWLLKARDGKGAFERKRRALHTWIVDPDCSNGYITWALLECGEKADTLRKEVDTIKAAALVSKNSYVMALGANIALLDNDSQTAAALMTTLAANQTSAGYVDGATTSIVGSGGTALQVETTALAVLAWLQDASHAANVEASMTWLADSCKAGRYGSTQSTVLALRAILAYDQARSTPKADGSIQLFIDGHRAGSAVNFDKETKGAIKLADIAEMLEPGTHQVKVVMTGGSEMPFSLAVNYADEKPDSSSACNIGIEVELVDGKVAEGDVTEAIVQVTNRSDKAVPTPIAIIGVPGGLEVRHDQLKELVKSGKIAAYEVLGREVVLYWRSFEAGQDVTLPISLVAEIPGTYTGPASRAYEYYTDEHKSWVAPLKVDIAAKAE
jgi:alpha-2-macroglobulin-like protein